MNLPWFIIVSVLYILSLSLCDGLFNRLIFREHRTRPHDAPQKQKIYTLWEWKAIGLIYIIILPLVLPAFVSYTIGGITYLFIYLLAFAVIQWDMVFGLLVFGDWRKDTPSIALPKIGWIRVSLQHAIIVRFVVISVIAILLSTI